MSGLPRIALPAAVGGVAVVLALTIGLWLRGPAPAGGPPAYGDRTGRERSWFVARGLHPAEFDSAAQRHFSWSSERFVIEVPHLDRGAPHDLIVSLRAAWPDHERPLPDVTVAVDGIRTAQAATTGEWQELVIRVPESRRASAIVVVTLSDVFVPGPQDRRSLGVAVESVAIAPAEGGAFSLPQATRRDAMLATAAVGAAAGVLRVPLGIGVLLAAAAAAGHAWLLLYDAAFLGEYAGRLVAIAVGVLAAAVAIRIAASRLRNPLLREWQPVAGIVLPIVALKLAVFGHSHINMGDALFHVHRAEWVESGRYFFTSITPRPFFEFPYAIGLYVTSLPVWAFFPTKPDRILLLRGMALVADALVGLAFWFVIRRFWPSRTAALFCAVLVPVLRSGTLVLCSANLTNLFAQAMFSIGLAIMIGRAGAGSPAVSVALAGAFLAYGFLSHFGTLSVGVPLVAAIGASMLLTGDRRQRATAWWAAVALAVALAVSYGSYYSRFHDVYRKTAERVVARDGASERSMVAPPAVKLERTLAGVRQSYGLPALALAGAGLVVLIGRRATDPLSLALVAWAGTWLALGALAVLTPIELRANLAAEPLVACLAACALAALSDRGGWFWRGAAAVGLAVLLIDGLGEWAGCIAGSG